MGKSKKAVERRVEPLVVQCVSNSLTDEIGVLGHISAWDEANAIKKTRDIKHGERQ